mmetsp:Transcript_130515/g.225682  ORF Transcript_130515/g.225682 Transcript_130515/m.225682 type:complete len:142 (+) Transcript_130515:656-1081(+)
MPLRVRAGIQGLSQAVAHLWDDEMRKHLSTDQLPAWVRPSLGDEHSTWDWLQVHAGLHMHTTRGNPEKEGTRHRIEGINHTVVQEVRGVWEGWAKGNGMSGLACLAPSHWVEEVRFRVMVRSGAPIQCGTSVCHGYGQLAY